MTQAPVVSVCFITYNQAPYVAKALESILAQDFAQPWEIVIADDLSTDGTREILSDYESQYPSRIRILDRTHNMGPGPNFVDLLLSAKGQYIAYLEGDDYWCDPAKLSKQIAYMDAHPETVLTWHNYHIIDENNKIVRSHVANGAKQDYTAAELKQINSLKSLTICFRNVIRQFPSNYLQCPNGDTYLYALLGESGNARFLSDIEPSCYRAHSGGTWSMVNQLKKDYKAILSYEAIAEHTLQKGDNATTDYYIDRLIKTHYAITYQHRTAKQWLKCVRLFFASLRVIIHFRKLNWTPSIVRYYTRIILLNQPIFWSHRATT